MTRTYCAYYCSSSYGVCKIEEVTSRTPPPLPSDCCRYQFYDIEELEHNGELLKGKPKNHSGFFYYGKLCTWDEAIAIKPIMKAIARPADHSRLLVHCLTDKLFYFDPDTDVILPPLTSK